jgi:hypothetical protein
MDRPEPRAAESCRFVVAPKLGRWRVTRDGADAGAFPTLEDAVALACAEARAGAHAGILGLVVVQGEVKEMHCFTPPVRAQAPRPPRLRLVPRAS